MTEPEPELVDETEPKIERKPEVQLKTQSSELDLVTGEKDMGEIQIVARRIQFAQGFTVLYVTTFVLQSSLLIWGIILHVQYGQNHENAAYIVLDVFVTLALVVEVFVRMLATHKYWSSCWNWVDVIVCVISLSFLGLYAVGSDILLFGLIASVVRYLMQLIRVSNVLRNWIKRGRQIRASIATIDLSSPPPALPELDSYFDAERTELAISDSQINEMFFSVNNSRRVAEEKDIELTEPPKS